MACFNGIKLLQKVFESPCKCRESPTPYTHSHTQYIVLPHPQSLSPLFLFLQNSGIERQLHQNSHWSSSFITINIYRYREIKRENEGDIYRDKAWRSRDSRLRDLRGSGGLKAKAARIKTIFYWWNMNELGPVDFTGLLAYNYVTASSMWIIKALKN